MRPPSACNPSAIELSPPEAWLRDLGPLVLGDADALAHEVGARLTKGEYAAAFALADRRLRMRAPSATDLFLRALAHRGAGRLEAAVADLDAAIALDPTDPALDAAALAWGGETARAQSARRIVEREGSPSSMRRRAVAALAQAGATLMPRLRRGREGVSGWIAWTGGGPLRIEVLGAGEPQSFELDPDPDHPLAADDIAAAEVAIEIADAGASLRLKGAAGETLELAPQAGPRARPATPAPAPPRQPPADFVTIVVPVYEDYAATRACLNALLAAPPACPHEIVVVDDASPNAELKAYLDIIAAARAVRLIRNAANLGFAASVNKALAARRPGDALLLNADALLPPGAVDRLAALSRAAPGVGALTPFSNNGELTSYPTPHTANPMPSAEEIARIDAAARAANADALVDIPNGVGFCLYITQTCLEAVGALPEVYAQGYFEDVEFCLLARERGFRNVAAPGVYVGHAGSKSFAERKRALVMRNREIVEARFPGLERETAAFLALDPLKPFRAALDAALAPAKPAILVVSGPSARASAQRRAERLAQDQPEAAVLTLAADPRGEIALAAVGGGAPQSLSFAGDAVALAAYLGRLAIARIEWCDPAGLPEPTLSALIGLAAPKDFVCDDFAAFAVSPQPPGGPCADRGEAAPCESCRRLAVERPDETRRLRRAKLGRALESVQRFRPQDRLAASFCERVFKARALPFDAEPRAPAKRGAPFGRLGVLYARRTPATERLLLRLARRLAGRGGELIVIGAALDEAAMMATGAAFVTGRAAPEEYASLARDHSVEALLAPDRGAGFGDLETAAGALGAPCAYFDWTFGAFPTNEGDLSLDPRICDEKAVGQIVAWMNGELAGQG